MERHKGLAKRQHTFPKKSISRFGTKIDKRIVVQVFDKRKNIRDRNREPDDIYFCARRAWDHATEQPLEPQPFRVPEQPQNKTNLSAIDGKFQEIVDRVLEGEHNLSQVDQDFISEFYVAWTLRCMLRKKPVQDQRWHGPRTPPHMEAATERIGGVFFINEDGIVPGHLIAGSLLKIHIEINRERIADTTWGIVKSHSDEEQFIVPDNFIQYGIVPVSPGLLLVAGSKNGTLSARSLRIYNALAVRSSRIYYFAKDLNKCPFTFELSPFYFFVKESNGHIHFNPQSLTSRFEPFPDL